MKLALICLLVGLLGQGTLAAYYTPISVGANGLSSAAKVLSIVSSVVTKLYTNLNTARDTVMPKITDLQKYFNTTYKALNTTYGATQPSMSSFMYNLDWFTQQFFYGDQQVTSALGMDLNQLNSQLTQGIDQIMQSYNTLLSSYSYMPKGEFCTAQNATAMSNVAVDLSKYGSCLQTEVDTVPLVTPQLVSILATVKADLTSLNQQINICAPTSTNCLSQYFMDIYQEVSSINMELYMAANMLQYFQQDASQRNSFCGELVKTNIQDKTQNLMSQMSRCSYPQTM